MVFQAKSGPFFAKRIVRHLAVGMTLSLLLAAGIASADPMPLVIAVVSMTSRLFSPTNDSRCRPGTSRKT